MHLILRAKELDNLGLWDEFVKLRKIRNSEAYLWGCIERDEFELTPQELKHLGLDITLDDKSKDDLGVTVVSKCCNTRFSIFVRDIDNFWFCPSCGDKLNIY